MKILRIVAILFCITLNSHAQSTETGTSQEFDGSVSGNESTTVIKLFGIEYNGGEIPITLIYNHSGIKINEKGGSVGYGWQIQNMGIINRTVNYHNDSNPINGWFNSADPSFASASNFGNCNECIYGDYPGNDLSPDFFSLNTADGTNFDFLYKKSATGGSPEPVFLSGDSDFKINTTFSNFTTDCTYKAGTVFNIVKNDGIIYNFINGPILQDLHRNQTAKCRNDFYLKSISNALNNQTIDIEYVTHNIMEKNHYSVGYNATSSSNPQNQSDYENNIIHESNYDYFFIDKTQYDIKKITSATNVINFKYFIHPWFPGKELLEEIEIKDLNGNYVTGFKFTYTEFEQPLIGKIEKYDVTKTQLQKLYEFDYYNCCGNFYNEDGHYEDYFGYGNGVYKESTNLSPFRKRISTTIHDAADYSPNILYAKDWSLSKITNRFGGTVNFDYQLNAYANSHYGYLYAGGIRMSSKKTISNIGTPLLMTYSYEDLLGYSIQTDYLEHHYIKPFYGINSNGGVKFYSSIPTLDIIEGINPAESILNDIHSFGYYYRKVTQTAINPDLGSQLYQVVKEYVPDYEGINKSGLIKHETHYDAIGTIVKKLDYSYNYTTLESINAANYMRELRNSKFLIRKGNRAIAINRVNLASVNTTFYDGGQISNLTTYTYISNKKKIRSIFETSPTASSEARFYYADDAAMSSEPYVNDLRNKNIIGIPIRIENYKNGELLKREKILYKNWSSTILAPEIQQSGKGTDAFENFHYSTIDVSNGNLIEEHQENGVSTVYIWGYNKSKIVAKIVNATIAAVTPYISNIQNLSNADTDSCMSPTCTEEILRTALNNLRLVFPNALITTYTYNPLVGITSVTDPKGDRIRYEYDAFGQMLTTRDKNENIISATQYHYSQN